jgi:hypothetical protein
MLIHLLDPIDEIGKYYQAENQPNVMPWFNNPHLVDSAASVVLPPGNSSDIVDEIFFKTIHGTIENAQGRSLVFLVDTSRQPVSNCSVPIQSIVVVLVLSGFLASVQACCGLVHTPLAPPSFFFLRQRKHCRRRRSLEPACCSLRL